MAPGQVWPRSDLLDVLITEAPGAVGLFDHDLRGVLVSADFASLFNCGPDDLVGRRPTDLDSAVAAGVEQVLADALAGGRPILEADTAEDPVDPSGSELPRFRCDPIEREVNGRLVAGLVIREIEPGQGGRLPGGTPLPSSGVDEGLSSTDPLTGLANHSRFQERLRQEAQRAERHGRALSLAIVDVDDFKGRNDMFGHQAGDAILIAVGRNLRAMGRATDLVARIGGDEFAVLMPETAAEAAEVMADRAHEAIRSEVIDGRVGVTVSIGICDMEHARTADDLLRFADGALYWAKAHGRDAVWRYSPEAVEDLSSDQRAARLARLQVLAGVRTLARAIDAKDHSTLMHSERVASISARLAEALDWAPERVAALYEAALIHDVGKIGVPDAVLLKPGRLDPAEYDVIRTHAVLGAQIASEVLSDEQTAWVRQHHERYDGTGYPDGLAGEQITDGAQLLALADSWDVMTSDRPYAAAMPVLDALKECQSCAGRQFSPDAVAVLTAPTFKRTLRIFANEQSARYDNETLLADASGPIFRLSCECGYEDCETVVEIPSADYRIVRLHARRYIVHNGHELPDVELVLIRTHDYTVVEKPVTRLSSPEPPRTT